MKILLAAASLSLCVAAGAAALPADDAGAQALDAMKPDVRQQVLEFERSLHPQSGIVKVDGGKASLDLGDNFYFLPAADAKRLLTDAWGNPPDSVGDVLGMVFPKGAHFYDGTWGAVLSYEDTGHIDDKDAASEDYDSVLADLKSGEDEENEARKQAGFDAVHTVGWAQAPTYDSASKMLIWARNIHFDGEEGNTLNYDVRKLARTGVLSMNMVSSMDRLGEVQTAAKALGDTVQFDAGSRYADFDSSVDHTADYGLAGLVAGGVGLAVAKKAGLIGILLIFLKKGLVILIAAAAGAFAWVKRKLANRKDELEAETYYEVGSEASSEASSGDAESETGTTG